MVENRKPLALMVLNMGKVVQFEVDGIVLERRIVITAMKRDEEISQASPVGHFIGNAQPGVIGVVHVPGGDSVVKVLRIL